MVIRPSACPKVRVFRLSRLLALGASLAMSMTMSAAAQTEGTKFTRECALREIKVITLIEEHGAADDLPAAQLGEAGLTMLHARSTCYQGRVHEALALYDSILNLGPVASRSVLQQ